MPRIFISYRRDDSQWPADRLYAAIKSQLTGSDSDVFIDVDNIPPGADFSEHLDRKVSQCDVLLALIGADWLNTRSQETGSRRLDDPQDFVRLEIAAALRRGIPVVPVMLDGTQVPKADQLPDDLKPLALRNAVEVRRLTFDADVARLVRGLGIDAEPDRRTLPQAKPRKAGGLLAVVVVLVLAVGVGAYGWVADPFGWRGGDAAMKTAPSACSASGSIEIEGQDIICMTDKMAADILSTPAIAAREMPPRIIIDAEYFRNESAQTLNKNSITDRLRVSLNKSAAGRLTFVSRQDSSMIASERELKREGVVDTGTTGMTRAQMGADYRLSGRITSVDQAGSDNVIRYNQIVFEMIDLETGEVAWSNIYEFIRSEAPDVIYSTPDTKDPT